LQDYWPWCRWCGQQHWMRCLLWCILMGLLTIMEGTWLQWRAWCSCAERTWIKFRRKSKQRGNVQHIKHFVNNFKYMIMYGTHTIVHFFLITWLPKFFFAKLYTCHGGGKIKRTN
jgi:cyanate permease